MNQQYKISFIIKYHRKKLGLTQRQLADLSGVGKTVIFDLEKGKSTVGFNIICKVLKALNINLLFASQHTAETAEIKI
ncbi:MAG: helix-turn-helix transcriptional regulator [Ignavibacteriae bacterium]|nr:transcriptional regulator [Ignavibacteriota bacterium]NOG98866.1 helix-turn-helix transcriptional regulator [Ignavibacteriota bacterium]